MPGRKSGPPSASPRPRRAKPPPGLPDVNAAAPERGAAESSPPFPIAAVGASAGGIEAFSALLRELPVDTGMAFVILQHLSPSYESMLAGILARLTQMAVTEVREDTDIEPNHVYVLPPNKHLAFSRGRLELVPRTEGPGQSRPIDYFMRSLAEGHGHKAIGVVLSGIANDGTLGLEEIKAGGGITFAQDSTAEQASMPRSAIAAGAVDYVLPPEEIARELGRIARHPYVAPHDLDPSATQEPAFVRVLDMLRQATGLDFANYKRNTLHRRITRRMVLHKLDGLREYIRFLQATPDEIQALYQDVLINVTSFFRNPEGYEALKATIFPKLTEDRQRNDPLRVWTLGCSTGEEAYSLAMAYTEYAEGAGRRVPMQIFATDVNGVGIEKARTGVYAKAIAQDVSPDRLRRFFVEADGSFRIAKPIRDMVVFARQNALSDPPFSRMDLVACRNMLIYLDPVLQQRMILLLHYALRKDGFLWLGGSETIGTYRDLFDLIDVRNKIYARKGSKRVPQLAVPAPSARWSKVGEPVHVALTPPRDFGPDAQKEADRMLLSRYAPPGVVLSEELEVMQFRGDTGAYLTPAPGRATLSFLKMLREGLMVSVRGALARVRREKLPVREEGLRVRSEGGWREVDIEVVPLRGVAGDSGYLVLFEEPSLRAEARTREMAAEMRAAADKAPAGHDESSRAEITRLTQELSATREYLQSVIEQQEAANEELQSANEEVQSANEELQSINEELETSKEEIQSSNEELATVNDELQNRNLELSQSNNDLTNLLASVSMAIVMLGPDLRIRRFTQQAEKMLNLIHADVGRPLSDIKLNIDVPDLEAIILDVIETMATRETEVRDRNGRWHSLRVRPYRTSENRIDGAVLMLIDIDNIKGAEQSLRESEQRFEVLANSAPVLIWVNDLEGCRFVNRAFEEFVGETEADIRRLGQAGFIHPEERQAYEEAYRESLGRKETFSLRARLRRADGDYRWMKHVAMPRFAGSGELAGYVGSSFDISDMAEAEQALLELDRGKNEFLALLAHELRNPLSGVHNASRLLSESSDPRVLDRARHMIDRQTTHMVRMIDDLLDISRITYSKIRLQPEVVDVVGILRRSVETTGATREEMRQSLTQALPDDALFVNGDPVRLEQIFSNLLTNASKFSRHGGRIWVSAESEPGTPPQVVVRVRDNGVGIDHVLLPRIFDLFVQDDRDSERSRSGIGLGLSLARRLVDLHGGTIEAHSAGDSLGSEFVVHLPLVPAPAATVPGSPAQAMARTPHRVLIVDDNEDSAGALEMLLHIHGHATRVMSEGAGVAAEAKAFRADAIVLDIGLPDLSGYDVARAVRASPATRDVFIVAVTGFGRDTDREKSKAAGIDIHMTKPVDLDALLAGLAQPRGRKAP